MGAAACSCSTRSSPTSSTSTCSTPTKIIPEELVPVRRSAGWCSTAWSTTSSPRPSRSRSARRTSSPGIDFTQRPAAAGPQLLLPRHAAEAARRPELHAHPDQRAEMPVRAFPAGRPHGDAQPEGPRQLRAELAGGDGARANRRSAASARFPSRGAAPKRARPRRDASPTTTARRGSSTSARPRSSRRHIADALVFELSKVETPAIRARDGLAPAEHRRGAGQARSPTGLGLKDDAEAAPTRRGRRVRTCKPSPALSIIAERAEALRGPQARRAGHRRRRCRRCSTALQAGGRRPKARCSRSSRRRSAA